MENYTFLYFSNFVINCWKHLVSVCRLALELSKWYLVTLTFGDFMHTWVLCCRRVHSTHPECWSWAKKKAISAEAPAICAGHIIANTWNNNMRKQQVTFPESYCGGSKTRTQTSACLNSKTHIVSALRFWFYPSCLFFSGNSTLLFQK